MHKINRRHFLGTAAGAGAALAGLARTRDLLLPRLLSGQLNLKTD